MWYRNVQFDYAPDPNYERKKENKGIRREHSQKTSDQMRRERLCPVVNFWLGYWR